MKMYIIIFTNCFYYVGIPYAKPPVGPLRFAKPQPFGSFTGGSLTATSFGNDCPQLSLAGITGDEDCLFLNVYKPAPKRNSRSAKVIYNK